MTHTNRSHRSGEAGSAYIIALLVLVVLTIMGLGLALITQTEMEVGANEKTMQRLFYAADAAIERSTAATLYNFDCAHVPGNEFELDDQDTLITQQVEISPVLNVLETNCNLCAVNSSGGADDDSAQNYAWIHHAVSAEAVRVGPGGKEYGRRTVASILALQPWPTDIASCKQLELDAAYVAEVKM